MGRPSERVAEHFEADDLPGLVLLFAGALSCGISFRLVQWYSVPDGGGRGFTFSDLHAEADQLTAPVAAAYFDRVAWGLVGAAVLLGLAARLVGATLAALLRVLAFLAAVAGVVLTYYSLAQLLDAQHLAGAAVHPVLRDTTYGFYLVFAGYLSMAVGALVGYRAARRRHGLATL